jgi:hypothetical protein
MVVSVKPMLDAKPGTPLAKVAAVMTGFTVHEIGHTKLDFYTAIEKRWPKKHLPKVLGNIIEDVVLEQRTVAKYPGFADHGDGNIFRPTLEWMADLTCPKTPLVWKGSTGHKVNIVGQVLRYREFVTFGNDAETQAALNFVEQWATGITAALGPSGCVTLIEELLAYMKATKEQETPEPPVPPTTECEFPFGNGGQQEIPDEDDDDTEGGDTDGEGGEDGEDGQPGGGNGEAEDGDEDGDTEGEGEGDGDGSDDGDGDGDDTTEGGEGEGEGARSGDGNDADHGNRTEAPKGTNDGDGKGGSGQSVSEAGDEGDVDDGFDEADLDKTLDEVSKPEGYEQNRIATAEADERVTTRMDAGAHGKMRVIFR